MDPFGPTTDQLAEALYWPFPPPEGFMFDHDSLKHWFQLGSLVSQDASAMSASAGNRLVALALACHGIIGETLTVERLAADTPDGAGELRERSRAAVVAFVDGVTGTPPSVSERHLQNAPTEASRYRPTSDAHVPLPVWQPGEQLAPIDLLSLAARFRTATRLPDVGAAAEAFDAAANRLAEAAATRQS